jgi:RNA polymerase sigma-70 factor (ECF subfamily)
MDNFTHASDQELLYYIQQSNQRAFEVLYYRYYALLCHVAYRRVPSEEIVEEIVQDVWVNFWQKAGQLDSFSNIQAYLYVTLRNKILHYLRSEKIRKYYENKFQELELLSRNRQQFSDVVLSEKAMLELIQDTISSLPPQCKEAFILSREEQLSYREIAERMRLSISTVEKHIMKALQILRLKLAHWNKGLQIFIFLSITVEKCNHSIGTWIHKIFN